MVVWPTRPLCHDPKWADPEWRKQAESITWQLHPGGYRSCAFCGSMHPGDLFGAIFDDHARLAGADWKYGWPHKFYLEEWTTRAKWYNVHFTELEEDGFDLLAPAVSEVSGIEWYRDETGRTNYLSPHWGFQQTTWEFPAFPLDEEDEQ